MLRQLYHMFKRKTSKSAARTAPARVRTAPPPKPRESVPAPEIRSAPISEPPQKAYELTTFHETYPLDLARRICELAYSNIQERILYSTGKNTTYEYEDANGKSHPGSKSQSASAYYVDQPDNKNMVTTPRPRHNLFTVIGYPQEFDKPANRFRMYGAPDEDESKIEAALLSLKQEGVLVPYTASETKAQQQ